MPPSAIFPLSRQSSISVAVRVRPFTDQEENKRIYEPTSPIFCGDGGFSSTPKNDENESKSSKQMPSGLRKIVEVVDDKMLIFDPPAQNPLASMQRRAFPNGQFRGRIRDYRFVFDHLFDETATQHDVFLKTTRPLLDNVLDGYNATVFAYGATGCGKTHTISGTPENPGVIFLTMEELYRKIGLVADTRIVDVSVSFLEIYNETIRDLLAPETPTKKLILREDSNKRIVVANLSAHKPNTVNDVMDLLVAGNRNRTSSPTEANAASSRSHAVLQINVTSHARTASLSEEHTYATLSVIDLAGSERAAATKNRGVRLNEGANINKSLLALGNCINALCDPGRRNHVPYRDSKLTRLLKFSLGGNCQTVMIVCVSPSSQHYDETLNTLKYANRAKEIKTKVSRNRASLDRHVGSYLKMITEQKLEIDELRARETTVLLAQQKKFEESNAACCQAIVDAVGHARASFDRYSHERWRRCFSLAKRKFLLLHLSDLHTAVTHVQQLLHPADVTPPHSVRRFLVQAEQLQRKFNEQIISLEKFFESRSSTDPEMLVQQSVEHALKKCTEMDGWTAAHTQLFHDMSSSLDVHSQKDLLVNSSILFDFLVGEMGSFAYLPKAICDTIDVAHQFRNGSGEGSAAGIDQILENATFVLEKMNDSEYDLHLEEATARFISARNEQTDLHVSRDKRASTSPYRNSPASKRTMRMSGPVEESDISMDDASFLRKSELDDDSPIANRVNNSMLDFDAYQNVLDSPPPAPPSSIDHEHRGRNAGSRVSSFAEIQSLSPTDPLPPSKHSLLNKQASLKVANVEGEKGSVIADSMNPE